MFPVIDQHDRFRTRFDCSVLLCRLFSKEHTAGARINHFGLVVHKERKKNDTIYEWRILELDILFGREVWDVGALNITYLNCSKKKQYPIRIL